MKNLVRILIIGERKSGKSTLINSIIKINFFTKKKINNNFISSNNNILIKNNTCLKFIELNNLNASLINMNFIFIVFDLSKKNVIEKFLLMKKNFSTQQNIMIILNKIDLIEKKIDIIAILSKFRKKNYKDIFLISAVNNDGVIDISKILLYKISSYKEALTINYFNKCNIKKLFLNIIEKEIYKNIKDNTYKNIRNKINFWSEKKESIIIGFEIITKEKRLKNKLLDNKAKKIKNINIGIKIKLEKLVKKNTYVYSFLRDK